MNNQAENTEQVLRKQAQKDGITHLSTGVAILQGGKILMVKRAKGDYLAGNYELPGGGVDPGETVADGAIREALEETGLKVSKVIDMFDGFDYSTDKKPSVRQFNFLVQVEPGPVTLDPNEHDAFAWVDTQNINKISMSTNMKKCALAALNNKPK